MEFPHSWSPPMENNSNFVVPYHDPHDDLLNPILFFNSSNPSLDDSSNCRPMQEAQLSENNGPTLSQRSLQEEIDQANGNDDDSFMDIILEEQLMFLSPQSRILNFEADSSQIYGVQSLSLSHIYGVQIPHETNNFEAGLSQIHGIDEGLQASDNNSRLQYYNNNSVVPPAFCPQTTPPVSCGCCKVLRAIVYTNGINFRKLELHGETGFISHALCYKNITTNASSSKSIGQQYEIIDFSQKSNVNEQVKKEITEYCVKCNAEGYVIVRDPLSEFYEAICTGFEWVVDSNDEVSSDDNEDILDSEEDDEEEGEGVGGVAKNGKTPSLAEQRRRLKKITMEDLQPYLHLPIKKAAKELNICTTSLKKIRRRFGIARWPARKIKGVQNRINKIRETRDPNDESIQEGINGLETQVINYCGGYRPRVLP